MEEKGEREEFEEEESRLLQVSGVIEDVPDGIRVGDEACLPASTSPIARASIHLQDILSFIVLIADSLFGYYQVCHVDAAVGQPSLQSQV